MADERLFNYCRNEGGNQRDGQRNNGGNSADSADSRHSCVRLFVTAAEAAELAKYDHESLTVNEIYMAGIKALRSEVELRTKDRGRSST